jgi:hypothetical protein
MYFSEIPTFYQNDLAMRNTAEVTGARPIAVYSQPISGVSADNTLVAVYEIHGRKGEVLFSLLCPDHHTLNFLLYSSPIG